MKVKFLKDCKGSENGYTVLTFKKGEIHEVSDSLAESFIDMGVIGLVEEKAATAPVNKSLDAPKNKSSKSSKEDKKGK